MYSEIYGMTVFGLSAFVIRIETDAGPGLPCFELSGFLNTEVREARERVKIAIKNSGYKLHPQRIVINFSPADLRKNGTGLDLPAAIGVLAANKFIQSDKLNEIIFIGELSFDGSIRQVKGCLPALMESKQRGFKYVFIPFDNRQEGMYVEGIKIIPVNSLSQAAFILNNDTLDMNSINRNISKSNKINGDNKNNKKSVDVDFKDIKGQFMAKKATLLAAAGMHNIIYIGSPGSGKSMFAKRIPTILPPLSFNEKLELSKIYSVSGFLKKGEGLVNERPFRCPGQNITESALLGGGTTPEPGEVTLASKGVLFLDEMTQYSTQVIESLRQPLEDKRVVVSRTRYTAVFPADFMLVAAMNPCKCGYFPDRTRCFCSDIDIDKYFGKISGPMLDRFDIRIRTEPVSFDDIFSENEEVSEMTSEKMRIKVCDAQKIQQERFKNSSHDFNSEMSEQEIKKYCRLGDEEKRYMRKVFEKYKITARGCSRILKTARTAADIDGVENISKKHLSLATIFRNNDIRRDKLEG